MILTEHKQFFNDITVDLLLKLPKFKWFCCFLHRQLQSFVECLLKIHKDIEGAKYLSL